jgi:xylulokinase
MDIRRKGWHSRAVAVTAPDLLERLPRIEPSDSVAGPVSEYFVRRHGLRQDAAVVTWTGDNPSSLIGVGLVQSGAVTISLGTSDTRFGFMPVLHTDPRGEGHVFGSPTGDYMSLICFKNGSLARENVRDRFRLDWETFSEILDTTPPGNRGRIVLPWFEPEIVPKVLTPGPRCYGLAEGDAEGWVRGVVEAQMLSMRLHSRWGGVDVRSIRATGGASANRSILQVMADVHRSEVAPLRVGNSAALGAALRAARWAGGAGRPAFSWDDLVARFVLPGSAETVTPRTEVSDLYDAMLPVYEACEAHGLGEGDDPERIRTAFAERCPGD